MTFRRHLLTVFLSVLTITLSAASKKKVACVGNSITYGLTLADRKTESYPSRLQKLLGNDYVVGNFGKSGATLLTKGHRPYIKQEEYQQALDFKADIVILHLGTNDTDPRNWPNYSDEFVGDYTRLINSFRQINPEVRIIIAKLAPITNAHPRFLSGTRDWRYQIQDAIETVAETTGVELIDFGNLLQPYPNFIPDAVHPNAEGAMLLAQYVYSAITGNFGGLSMSKLYTDNMVLQRDIPINIKGMADRGEKITIKFDKTIYNTSANHDGQWTVTIPALAAGGPHSLIVSTKSKKLSFSNIMAGDVWLCSGQSNMEFMMHQAKDSDADIAKAGKKQIRMFDEKAIWRTNDTEWSSTALDSINKLNYFTSTTWQNDSPETASQFSAIAYYFGKMINDSLNIPIGLICNAVGGSEIEAWIDRTTLENDFPQILNDWTNNDFIQDWVRKRAKKNMSLSTTVMQRHPYEPAYLYEASIVQMSDFPIKGVLWYQGESNAHNCESYAKLFPLLVNSWRKTWHNETMPIYFVQLSSINRPSWPKFRNMQRQLAESMENVWMAVSSDKGDPQDVHPIDKKPIGERLALQALHNSYGYNITSAGPTIKKVRLNNNSVILTMENGSNMHTADQQEVRGFEIAEYDGLYEPATAEISENEVILKCSKVKNPKFVRYAWKPFTTANIVNGDKLPMSTIKIEIKHYKE